MIIPEDFRDGLLVVLFISTAKLSDTVLGNNNAILFNSDYYRMVLFFGVILTVMIVFLNMVFIPIYGINGSAFATFIAVLIYNIIKLMFIKKKLNMLPFTESTFKLSVLLLICILGFYFWDFTFHPIINMTLKSILIGIIYTIAVYRMNISEEVNGIIKRYLKFN
jgi:O-antigen/teichoic acid export membrane protein